MKRTVFYLTAPVLFLLTVWLPVQAQRIPSEIEAVRLDWNPTGNFIAVTDGGSVVTILEAQTRTVLNTLPAMPFPVRALRWSDDGTRLAIGGGYAIQIWDRAWERGQAVLSITLQAPPDPLRLNELNSVDWNDATHQILTTMLGRVFIWDSQTGQLIRTIEPVSMPIVSAAWSSDGVWLATGRLTGYVLIESVITNESGGADTYDLDAVLTMAWEPNGAKLIVGTNGGFLEALSFSPRRLGSDIISYRDDSVPIFATSWHPTRPLVVVGYANGSIEVWNPITYDVVQCIQDQTGTPVMSLAWSPDGTQLAYADGLDLVIVAAPTLEVSTQTPTPAYSSTPTLTTSSTPTPSLPLVNGLVAELYANPALEGTPAVTRLDPQVAFNWLLKVM